jgi:acyl-CoA synthetase (AMP-forming)/AMP-acid ligase II
MNPQSSEESGGAGGRRVVEILAGLADCNRTAFSTVQQSVPWSQWYESVTGLTGELRPLGGSRVGLIFRPSPSSYACMCALSSLDCDVFLFDRSLDSEVIEGSSRQHSIVAVVDPREDEPAATAQVRELGLRLPSDGRGELTICTSGSTGEPKAVRHDWNTLTRPVRQGEKATAQTCLLTYQPHLYAGIQVFMHCLINRATLVLPEPGMGVDDLIDLMRLRHVNFVSATPSYWRRLLTLGSHAKLAELPMEQITLGGEASDQALLDGLKKVFPRARVVHLYATSELGRCFSVKDGIAGFPADYLRGQTEEGVWLRLEDGELHVRSANAMLGANAPARNEAGEAGWIATGDLVEQRNDRCYFVGRRSELINVGGNKVHPLRVEQLVQEVEGVADARVFGKASSLVGQIVACEIVVEAGFSAESVKQEVMNAARQRLAPHERPRFVEVTGRIELSEAGKKIRRQGAASASGGQGRKHE